MPEDRKHIVAMARAEAQRMHAAIRAAEGQTRVTMPADQFTLLATLLDQLADTVSFWPEEELDDPRYWVPLGHFQRLQGEATHWRQEYDRLREKTALQDLLRF